MWYIARTMLCHEEENEKKKTTQTNTLCAHAQFSSLKWKQKKKSEHINTVCAEK